MEKPVRQISSLSKKLKKPENRTFYSQDGVIAVAFGNTNSFRESVHPRSDIKFICLNTTQKIMALIC